MNEPIRTGIVGFGISAKVFHAPFISSMDEYELVSVVERSTNNSQSVYPQVKIERSIEALLEDTAIELVVITTPNKTHFPYAKAALEAGKHVVLEKPFTNTTEEAEQLLEISRKSKGILSVYQNRRYVSDFLTIRDILKKDLLGEVNEYIAHYDRYRAEARPQAWREKPLEGSGILFDLGPHIIDQALYLFGLPTSITADIRLQRPHAQVDDYFELWLHYPTLKVTLHGGMLIREPGPRYLIHGDKGSFVKSGQDPQEAALRAGEKPVGENWGLEADEFRGILHTEIDGVVERMQIPTLKGDYSLYYKKLFDSIRHSASVSELPEHGYNTIRIVELAMESFHKKCTVECTGLLDVPYDTEHV